MKFHKQYLAFSVQNLLRQCMDDIASLMGCLPEQGPTVASEVQSAYIYIYIYIERERERERDHYKMY